MSRLCMNAGIEPLNHQNAQNLPFTSKINLGMGYSIIKQFLLAYLFQNIKANQNLNTSFSEWKEASVLYIHAYSLILICII